MHVISRKPFAEAAKKYRKQAAAIEQVYLILRKGVLKSPDELRKIFPSLDNFKYKKKWWVIDIGGKHLRLLAFIEFRDNRMYVKHITTHADYDKLTEKYRSSGD